MPTDVALSGDVAVESHRGTERVSARKSATARPAAITIRIGRCIAFGIS
jgi:hypothetical protein